MTVTKAMAGQFWIGHKAQDGYVIANPDTAQWHIDFQFAHDGSTARQRPGLRHRGHGHRERHRHLPDIKFVGGYANSTRQRHRYWSTAGPDSAGSYNDHHTPTEEFRRCWYANVLGLEPGGSGSTDFFTDGRCPANVVPA